MVYWNSSLVFIFLLYFSQDVLVPLSTKVCFKQEMEFLWYDMTAGFYIKCKFLAFFLLSYSYIVTIFGPVLVLNQMAVTWTGFSGYNVLKNSPLLSWFCLLWLPMLMDPLNI